MKPLWGGQIREEKTRKIEDLHLHQASINNNQKTKNGTPFHRHCHNPTNHPIITSPYITTSQQLLYSHRANYCILTISNYL
jgi:hypothetical protein